MSNNFNLQKLLEFLYKAKCSTFASGKKAERLEDWSRRFVYETGEFSYQDKYFGSLIDAGQEIVYYQEVPTWSMVYRGGMISDDKISRACFKFLKKCLINMPKEFPVRGPELRSDGDFVYKNTHAGDITNFTGQELILFKSEKIYHRDYLGGLIKFKQ